MTGRLIVEDRVVRERPSRPGPSRPGRAVIHTIDCEHAPGCVPLADLVEAITERGVLVRVRRGWITRCKTCRPSLIGFTVG